MSSDRYVNLVFQGGGVRGIAYAGALATLPPECKIHSVGGTSAGAIVAALVALGKSSKELEDVLGQDDLYKLVDLKAGPGGQLLSVYADAAKRFGSGGVTKTALAAFLWKHRKLMEPLREVVAKRGLFSSLNLQTWLFKQFENRVMGDLNGVPGDVKLVAANLRTGEYEIYAKSTHGNTPVRDALLASASIPLFFEPANNHFVDGGILSNFPAFLFQDTEYPTIGLRLKDVAPPAKVEPLVGTAFLRALVTTMVDAHDKRRRPPSGYTEYSIPTPGVHSTDFSLSRDQATSLFEKGKDVGREIPWRDLAASHPALSYVDSEPQLALQRCINEAGKLVELMAQGTYLVDELEDSADVDVWLDEDWTAHYVRTSTVTVRGTIPLMLGRLFVSDDQGVGVVDATPLARLDGRCVQVIDGVERPQITIPAVNEYSKKGFLVVYSPPILPGGPKRQITTRMTVPKEFARTLALGKRAEVSYTLQKRAHDHKLDRLQFTFYVPASLRRVSLSPQFAHQHETLAQEIHEGQVYNRLRCRTTGTAHPGVRYLVVVQPA